MRFWIYKNEELEDLLPKFEKIFGVNNLYHDYENVYEWVESENNLSKYYLNISRPHDWEKGEYYKPIIIDVKSNDNSTFSENEIAIKIKSELDFDVFSGEIYYDTKDEPLIKKSRKY